MSHGHPATASGPGVPYPDWPKPLGDPRWHRSDDGASRAARSRADIIAHFRVRKPEAHTPVSAKDQRRAAQQLQLSKFPPRICSFQVHCRRATATKRCHNCIQFDQLKLGYYCDDCFAARHPPNRLEHQWDPIEDVVNPEQSWVTHLANQNLEQDAQEIQLLLSQVQGVLHSSAGSSPTKSVGSRPGTRQIKSPLQPPQSPTKMRTPDGAIDFDRVRQSLVASATTLKDLMDQIHTELAKKPLTREDALVKIQTMWRIRRARKQMRELIRSVYQSAIDPSTGMTYYVNTRTNRTQWSKPRGLGAAELPHPKPSKNQHEHSEVKPKQSRLQEELSDIERRHIAAGMVQGMVRVHNARRAFRKLISSVYEKIWDETSNRFYYHNTKTKAVKWEKPRWVSDDELLTPRRRAELEERAAIALKQQRLVELRKQLTIEQAASMVQRAFRRRRGFRTLLEMCRNVYERIFDPSSNKFYYHNTRTKEVSWEKPLLLRNATVDVDSPRTRQNRLQAILARASALNRPQREWTEETAAVRLQGLYRARQARRALDERIAAAYKKVWDPSVNMYYYANLKTGAVSWDPPALLTRRKGVDVEELR